MINQAQQHCQNMDKEVVPSSSGIDIIDGETESDETPPVKKMLRSTHVKISQLVNKMCLQQFCYFIKLLQACQSQLVDKLLNCCWNNL